MKKGKIVVSILTLVMLFTCATGIYFAMDKIDIKKVEKTANVNYNADLGNSNIIPSSIFVVSDSLMKEDNGSPYSRFASSNIPLSDDDQRTFNLEFTDWYDILNYEPNLKYQVINKSNQKTLSNVKDDLFSLINNKEQKSYQWFIQIDFDSEGNASFYLPIEDTLKKESYERRFSEYFETFKNESFRDYFYLDNENYNVNDDNSYDDIQVSLKNPKNISIVFAIPVKDNMVTQGEFYDNSFYYTNNHFEGQIALTLLIASIIIYLYTLIVPMKYLKELALFRNLMKIKIEILTIAGVFAGAGVIVLFVQSVSATLHGNISTFMSENQLGAFSELLSYIMIAGTSILFLLLIMLAAYALKIIFDKGITRFIKENTVIGWLCLNFVRLGDKVTTFDLDDPVNKSILKVVLLNFVIITVISFFFVFGFLFTTIYSILLFVLLRNKLNTIKYDYEVLLKATRKISNGEFDVDIKEDLGVFNSLRDEFSNIRDGFEKAVNEEVKSQRMKTELISNVSHDLKTPLTSIITYVDLLKNEEVSDEQRKEYIDTIDRNSLRLKNLIEDLFEVSKVNSGNVKLNLMDVDIVSLIKQAYFENVDKMQEKNLDFKMNFSDDKIVYNLDSSKTYRIFENLLINISKYALNNTRVYVDVQNYDNRVVIIFKNISENEINVDENELTERFVQGDTSRNTGGSGLGLAIAKSFTELQNGNFKIEVDGDLFKAIVTFKK